MDELLNYFKTNNGYARMRDLKEARFHTRLIARYLLEGKIEKVKPGLYRLSGLQPGRNGNLSYSDVCHAVPKGVICLKSALVYHELSTINPTEVCVAIPMSEKPRKFYDIPVKFYFFPERFYAIGIQKIKTPLGDLRLYNREKTICDMFRYRNIFGEDLALEALKKYLSSKDKNLFQLRSFALKCQVKTVMMPYLRALVAGS